jgi:immune inhibitor A
MDRQVKIVLSVALAVFVCLCCAGGAGGGAFVMRMLSLPVDTPSGGRLGYPTDSPEDETESPNPVYTPASGPTATAFAEGTTLDLSEPVSAEALETLQSLIAGDPPAGDLVEQAMRLKHIADIPRTVAESATPIAVGETREFNVSNMDNDQNLVITAEMRYATPHVYFWVDQDASARDSEIRDLVDIFEEKIYPTDREFFGPEWSPGIDGDEHLYILYARRLGSSVGGYYSPADEVPKAAHPFSNQHEMFYINADNMGLTEEYTLSVLAHEFQHMIHWYGDHNEESWVNEGFSELAVSLNGYNLGGADWMYVNQPDIQLTYWPDINDDESFAHYGGAFLFMNYFLGRFGREATQALVRNPANGLVGIDDTLSQMGISDPARDRMLTADDVMADFAAALLLQDTSADDGRYGFSEYPSLQSLDEITGINSCPGKKQSKKVSQYGFDYYAIGCSGSYTVYFAGQTVQKVLPVETPEGKYYVWSNRGDESDMTLTRAFDLPAGGGATLEFDLWYDIEEDWDYVYLEASVDDGKTWNILNTDYGTDSNPQGNSYGWGWTGASEDETSSGWVTEQVDLSAYAGERVQIRFEYITDAAVNGEGLIVDNIRIPEISYAADFESGLDGWEGEGFVRLENILPQSYRVLVVRRGAGVTVEELPLDERMAGKLVIDAADGEEVYLIVLGTARYTRQKAPYQFIVLP